MVSAVAVKFLIISLIYCLRSYPIKVCVHGCDGENMESSVCLDIQTLGDVCPLETFFSSSLIKFSETAVLSKYNEILKSCFLNEKVCVSSCLIFFCHTALLFFRRMPSQSAVLSLHNSPVRNGPR